MTSDALRIEDVHKSFGKLEVLRGIDLALAEHEVVCLIGASGSGKSTLLRCVNLLEPIDAGRILVRGEDVTAPGIDVNRVRRRIGIVFQAFNLFPHMTVLENVTLGPRKVLGLSKSRAVEEADRLLERFGLADKRTATGSRGVSSSAWRSSGRSRCSPSSCCWTRSRARSTPSSSRRSSTRSASSPREG
jgi:ABC-type polar amino acid transport system ATPase subunit